MRFYIRVEKCRRGSAGSQKEFPKLKLKGKVSCTWPFSEGPENKAFPQSGHVSGFKGMPAPPCFPCPALVEWP